MFEQSINIHQYCDDPHNIVALTQEIAKAKRYDVLNLIVNKIDVDGHTPLTLACLHGNIKAVEILLNVGAHPEAQNDLGLSPARVLKKNGGVCGKILELLCASMAEPVE